MAETQPLPPPDDPLETLVAECLAAQEAGDADAIERVCRAHPDHAKALRERLHRLTVAGLGMAADNTPAVPGFRVLQRLGAGGMGEVWRAEQLGPLRRQVALKIIRSGHADSAHVLARFESERQAMAMMSHPGIAQVFAAGALADGSPYFAMELIDGQPITDYCDHHRFNVRQRVELCIEVCRAVHHAHQRGVLHRDLKPGNILTTTIGGHPQPKVIDFGLAKALAEPFADRTMLTEIGQILGTPEYMSPEQAELTERGVDIRTDVYSLGVVLYVLLTGTLPLASERLRARGISELLRVIREEEPPRPSTVIARLGDAARGVADARSTNTATLQRTVRGDLEWILACAMAKDRERRYPTALDLGRDLENWLAARPVTAGPPSAGYRLRKFVRRNRLAVATATTILLVLIGALVVSTSFYLDRENSLTDLDRTVAIEPAENHVQVARNELWPVHPDRIPAFDQWLAEATRQLGERTATEERLAAVRSRARAPQAAALEARYEQYRDAILDRSLTRLLSAFAALDQLVADVRLRREQAASLHDRSIAAHATAWADAVATIRDRQRCPAYAGLEITPQIGLVPLGLNTAGLYEFAVWHPRLTLPVRDTTTGDLAISPDTTFVLVLLPAGKLIQGAQAGDPNDRNYDPQAGPNEAPTAGLMLDAFFLAKFEVTQEQWMCLGDGTNPSLWHSQRSDLQRPIGLMHPVEQVAWAAARQFARQLGLLLPTEAQWEYAARGGTRWPWGVTCEMRGLDEFANLRDLTSKFARMSYDWQTELHDWFEVHAPVGSFRPNQFGLHDMIGNVSEWVREPLTNYWEHEKLRPGDGERAHDAASPNRLARGGSYESRANQARVTFRQTMPVGPNATIGVRLARQLDVPRKADGAAR